jgi:membrane associated rhomboid family serine protease
MLIGIDQSKSAVLQDGAGNSVVNDRFAEEITAGADHDDFGSFGIGAHLKILSILMLFSIFNDYFQGVFSAGDTGFSAIASDVHFFPIFISVLLMLKISIIIYNKRLEITRITM